VFNSLKVPAGASLAIFGTGAVGLAAVMAARIVGPHPSSRSTSMTLGWTWRALSAPRTSSTDAKEDVRKRITELTGAGVDTCRDDRLPRMLSWLWMFSPRAESQH